MEEPGKQHWLKISVLLYGKMANRAQFQGKIG
jgi:hypothetical protein